MNNDTTYGLGEFASFELIEDEDSGQFKIVLKGKLQYGNMIAAKLEDLVFSADDLEEWSSESDG